MKFIILLLASFISASAAPTGQTLSPIEWVKGKPNAQGRTAHYMGQKETNGILILGPDQSYFTGRLRCFGKGPGNTPAQELNQNKSFAGIGGWNSATHEIRWHLWINQPGKITITPYLDVDQPGSEILFQLGDQTSRHLTNQSDGKTAQAWKVEFIIKQSGFHTLTLTGKPKGIEIAKILHLDVSGPAVKNSLALRSRWRAAAIHAGQFNSSAMDTSGTPAELIVMQVRPKLTTHSTYAPVTTPFGYYGSTFSPGGIVGGINFSMWSFGQGKKEPSLDQQSRLLAVGSPLARFSGFSHEGTGVKVRGWNPWANKKVDIQTIGLRIERQEKTSTFYGYFLDPDSNRWQLYAVGRKPNKPGRKNKGLSVGAFVEVPGRAEVQRTGDVPREIHYRGWACGKDGKWHPFDSINGAGRTKGIFNKVWSISKDHWFSMSMGGMAHYQYNQEGSLSCKPVDQKLPVFLQKQHTKALYQLPSTITLLPTSSPGSNSATINFELHCSTMGKNEKTGKATIYWGKKDALTFTKHWQKSTTINSVGQGKHSHQLNQLSPNTTYYFRILFENEDGSVWSFSSGKFKTKN